jgi:hypothetical protein
MISWEKRSSFDNYYTGSESSSNLEDVFNHKVMIKSLAIPSQEVTATKPLLVEGLNSLITLRGCLVAAPELAKAVEELIVYLQSVNDAERCARIKTRADLLRPLRDMLFWLPSRFIPTLHAGPYVMLLMAHLHAVALLVDPVRDSDSAYFRRLNVAPIQAFHEEFSKRARMEMKAGEREGPYELALTLMDFPLKAVAVFERRLLTFRSPGDYQSMDGEVMSSPDIINRVNYDGSLSTLKILENFPVGLWHNSIS